MSNLTMTRYEPSKAAKGSKSQEQPIHYRLREPSEVVKSEGYNL